MEQTIIECEECHNRLIYTWFNPKDEKKICGFCKPEENKDDI